MNAWLTLPARIESAAARFQAPLSDAFLLLLRLYVAKVFFQSGLTKLADFGSTVALFENEYRVPLLTPMLAAASGTAAELLLPALFALGLFTRPTALAFFVFNAVAVVSYPDISEAGIKDHWVWGAMIATVFMFGAGRASLDGLCARFATRRAAISVAA